VPLKVYDESISTLRSAVNAAKIDHSDKLRGLKVLHHMALSIEKNQSPFADVDKVIAFEREQSHKFGGMTIMGPATKPQVQQMSLFDN
jgi:hypothetical protein